MFKTISFCVSSIVSYILLQIVLFTITWIIYNGFRDPLEWIAINDWPDWLMVLNAFIAIYGIISISLESYFKEKEEVD